MIHVAPWLFQEPFARGDYPLETVRERPYSALEHLANSIWLTNFSKSNLFGMFTFYFDASGRKEVIVVSGYVSTIDRWLKFEKQWNHLLAHFKVKYFHMKEFAHSTGQFTSWKNKSGKRADFLKSLIQIVRNNALCSIAVALNLETYRVFNKHYKLRECGGIPYALCAGTCVEKAFRWIRKKKKTGPIVFVFEDGDVGKGALLKYMETRNYPPPVFRHKQPENPLDLPVTPLQAADLVAWEHQKLYIESSKEDGRDVRLSLLELTKMPHDWGRIEDRELKRICFRNNIPPRSERR